MENSRTIIWCDRVVVFAFCALAYFLPISKALVEIFAGVALLAFFIKRGAVFYRAQKDVEEDSRDNNFLGKLKLFLRSYKPVSSHLSRPIAIYIFFNFISLVFTQDLSSSIEGFFCKILQGTFIYFTFIESFKTKKQVQIFSSVFFVSAVLCIVNGFYQYFTGKGFIFGHPLMQGSRVLSCFNHSNELGAYLIIVFMFLLSILLRWKSYPR